MCPQKKKQKQQLKHNIDNIQHLRMSKRKSQFNVSPSFRNDDTNTDEISIDDDVNVNVTVNFDDENDTSNTTTTTTGTNSSSILKNRSDKKRIITYHDDNNNNTLSDVTKERTFSNNSLKKPNNSNSNSISSNGNTTTIVGNNNQHGLSFQSNNNTNHSSNNNTNNSNNNNNNNIVIFDVGGRIFKVRRSVIESFPDTMLARCTSDVWLSSSALLQTQPQQQLQQQQIQPIFIDRDSHRFSYVLDYMRDNCTVELPVTISKESFIRELHYFGFDISNTNNNGNDCISCAIPTYEAVMQVDKLHSNFCYHMKQMEMEKNYTIVAYACFCEFVYHRTLHCTFRASTTNNTTNIINNNNNIPLSSFQLQFASTPKPLMFGGFNNNNNSNNYIVDGSCKQQQNLLPSMTSIATKLPDNVSSLLSSLSIYNIAKSLATIYEQHKDCTTCYKHNTTTTIPPTVPTATNTSAGSSSTSCFGTGTGYNTSNNSNNNNNNHNNILLFDKCLSEYGFHCQNIHYCSSSYSVSIHLKQI